MGTLKEELEKWKKSRYQKPMSVALAEVRERHDCSKVHPGKRHQEWMNTEPVKHVKEDMFDEGRMKDIYTLDSEGKSAAEIAKRLNLRVSTVKSILGEQVETLHEFTDSQIASLKKDYAPLKGKTISGANANKLMKIFDKFDKSKPLLIKLLKANIPFVSMLAQARLISRHGANAAQLAQMRKEGYLNESFKVGDKVKFVDKGGAHFDKKGKVIRDHGDGSYSVEILFPSGRTLTPNNVKNKDIVKEEVLDEFTNFKSITFKPKGKYVSDGKYEIVYDYGRKALVTKKQLNVWLKQKFIEEELKEGGENDRVRELLQKQETKGLSNSEKKELRELIKTISAGMFEAKAPFRLSYSDKYGKHAGFEDAKTLQDLQNKAQKLRAKGFKIDKMGRNTSPVEQKLPEPEGKQIATEDSGYLQSKMSPTQIANIKNVWKNKKATDVTDAVRQMIKRMDIPTQLAIKSADIPHISKLVEDDDKAYAIGMAKAKEIKKDFGSPLKKSTIVKAHDIAKAIKKDEQVIGVGPKATFERLWLKHKRGDKAKR